MTTALPVTGHRLGWSRRTSILAITGTAVVLCALGVLFVSHYNPFIAAGANNRLESTCSQNRYLSWTYDRTSWTPLRWFCTVVDENGREIRINAY